MNKKIGCVIAYKKNHTNYGTALVGYALLKKLQQLGYEVEIIEYIKRLSLLDKILYVINAVMSGELKNIRKIIRNKRNLQNYSSYAKCIAERIKAVNAYKAEKILPFFHKYVGYEALHKGSLNYDVVVVGSDQVWTPMSLPNKFFNLLFVDNNIPKVSYASSFGVSKIPVFQKKATGSYLNRFKSIGVREQRGKEIVEELSKKKATVVADPTLLLDREEWENEIKHSQKNETSPYIFCYFLGTNQEARKAASELKKQTGYKIITIRHMDEYIASDETFGDEAPYNVNPNDFIKYISKAEYVCTDSFHCTAFSIQFHRKFMTFYRFPTNCKTERNSRIDSLFSILNIDKNHIYNGNIKLIDNEIDWNATDKKLSELRIRSIDFLKKSLE